MKPHLLLLFLSILILSCRQNNSLLENIEVSNIQSDTTNRSNYKKHILDTSKIAIIQDTSHSNFGQILTNTDLENIDSLLTLAVGDFNGSGRIIYNPRSIHLGNYKRQYSPFLDESKNKIVSIQCFCKDFDNSNFWKTHRLQIMDGGSCVFWLYINLTKKTYDKITIHGSA